MALLSTSGGAQKINCGSAAVLDDLVDATFLFWTKHASLPGTLGALLSKFTAAGANRTQAFVRSNGRIALWRSYATTRLELESASSTYTTGGWRYLALVLSSSLTATNSHIYLGSLTAAAAEVSYAVTQNGVGTAQSDADGDLHLYSYAGGTNFALGGDGSRVLIYNTVLTLAQIIAQQFQPAPLFGGCVGCWFPGANGTGDVPDWSGRGGTGVVSGSPTYSADVPVGPWFGRDVPRPYVVAAAGDTYARLIGGDLLHSNLIGQRLVA